MRSSKDATSGVRTRRVTPTLHVNIRTPRKGLQNLQHFGKTLGKKKNKKQHFSPSQFNLTSKHRLNMSCLAMSTLRHMTLISTQAVQRHSTTFQNPPKRPNMSVQTGSTRPEPSIDAFSTFHPQCEVLSQTVSAKSSFPLGGSGTGTGIFYRK